MSKSISIKIPSLHSFKSSDEGPKSLKKIIKILDNPLFPLFSFEPCNDIIKIDTIVSKSKKDQEKKTSFQQTSLNIKNLINNTFFQPYESLWQCLSYKNDHNYNKNTKILRINNEIIKNLSSIQKPQISNQKKGLINTYIFNMSQFYSMIIAFKKIEKHSRVSHGIFAKKLTSNPGKPILEDKLSDYIKNYFQTLILIKQITNNIIKDKLIDYFISWDSNAPTIVDYRFFMLSSKDFFRTQILDYYKDNLNQNISDFLFIHRPYYVQGIPNNSIGVLSSRWLLPLDFSNFTMSADIIRFKDHSFQIKPQTIQKDNYNYKDNNINPMVEKVFYSFERISSDLPENYQLDDIIYQQQQRQQIDLNYLSPIQFIPSDDFYNKNFNININEDFNLEKRNLNQEDLLKYQLLKNQKHKINNEKKILIDKLNFFNDDLNPKESDNIFPNFRFSHDIDADRDIFISDDYERRHMIQEILHQWSRDLISLDFMETQLKKNNNRFSLDIQFKNDYLLSSALSSNFDEIQLNIDYCSINNINGDTLSSKLAYNRLPLTIDDIIYRFILVLSKTYKMILENRKKEDIIETILNYDEGIVTLIHYFEPSNIINWLVLWLTIEDIPHYSGYNVAKADRIFNRRMLPLLYEIKLLPIKKAEISKQNCFDKTTFSNINNQYIWELLDFKNKLIPKRISEHIENQKNLCYAILDRDISYLIIQLQSKKSQDLNSFDIRRYITNRILNEDEFDKYKSLHQYSISKTDSNDINLKDYFKRIYDAQLISDFYLALINQYNSFVTNLIIEGNNFKQKNVKKHPVHQKEKMLKQKSGAFYHSDLINYQSIYNPEDDTTESAIQQLYLEEVILQGPGITFNPPLYWLMIHNKYLPKIKDVLLTIKKRIDNFQLPLINDLHYLTFIENNTSYLNQSYNERIIPAIEVINQIMEKIHYLIANDYFIDEVFLNNEIDVLNDLFDTFLDIYFEPNLNSNDKNKILFVEELDFIKLRTVQDRKKILERFIFIDEYIKQEYEIISSLSKTVDALNTQFANYDFTQQIFRYNHDMENINNVIDNVNSVSFKSSEVISLNLSIKPIKKKHLFNQLNDKVIIVNIKNFFNYASHIDTTHPLPMSFVNVFPMPVVKATWDFYIINHLGEKSVSESQEIYIDSMSILNEIMHPTQIKDKFKIYIPNINMDQIDFILSNKGCVMYGFLKLYWIKPYPFIKQIEYPSMGNFQTNQELEDFLNSETVVYHPLAYPNSKIKVLGQDILLNNDNNLFARLNRFKSNLYRNQPDEYLFLKADLIRFFID